jgi:hypothetical protein
MIEPTESVSSTPPDFLTLDEAAAVLRVGRSTAYREANAFERSGGRTGVVLAAFVVHEQIGRYASSGWPRKSLVATTQPIR